MDFSLWLNCQNVVPSPDDDFIWCCGEQLYVFADFTQQSTHITISDITCDCVTVSMKWKRTLVRCGGIMLLNDMTNWIIIFVLLSLFICLFIFKRCERTNKSLKFCCPFFVVGAAAHRWRFADVRQTCCVFKEIGRETTTTRSTSNSWTGCTITTAWRCTASISFAQIATSTGKLTSINKVIRDAFTQFIHQLLWATKFPTPKISIIENVVHQFVHSSATDVRTLHFHSLFIIN